MNTTLVLGKIEVASPPCAVGIDGTRMSLEQLAEGLRFAPRQSQQVAVGSFG
jgi:hypothetical protein